MARWRWKEGTSTVSCSCPNYAVPRADQAAMEEEVQAWIIAGVLVPWNEEEHGVVHNVVPLISISQRKGEMSKVWLVLDFRELNKNVMCLTGGTPTCEGKLKEWRKFGHQGSVIDLKWAYLQIHVARELWTYQAVRWNRHLYLLTRMGFGLNVAPRIMTAIVGAVLAADSEVQLVTSSYIDDVFMAV